ncbi:MAG: dihydrolipoyl dehydrogenase [Desulfitobacterium sp.]|nr:dihydrolipoyl dehydrogenase [Desulfitobacterium sp.]
MERFQIGILGGGPGGYVCALRAAQLGFSVVIVEGERLGGICLNKGCVPTKTLVKGAEVWREVKKAEDFGIQLGERTLDFPKLMARKDQVVETLVKGITQLMKKNKITVIEGWGEVKDPRHIEVSTESGKISLEVDHLVIATGSTPALLPIPGVDLPGVITSDEILALDKLPQSLVVIGGGVIGLEFASIFQELGSKVTVVEMLPTLLGNIDEEIPKRLTPLLKRSGMEVLTKNKVQKISQNSEGLIVEVENSKGSREIPTEMVLVATGRKPNLRGVDVEALGLEMERGAIQVNEYMETSVPNVYAIGDVTGGVMLAHVASMAGVVVAEHLAGLPSTMTEKIIPSVIFTYPEIAVVGATEQSLKESGKPYKVSKFPFSANGKAVTLGETIGLVKLLADEEGVLLGASIMGPEASNLIQECVLAIEMGVKAQDLAAIIHAHPTLPEAVQEAAHGIMERPIHLA